MFLGAIPGLLVIGAFFLIVTGLYAINFRVWKIEGAEGNPVITGTQDDIIFLRLGVPNFHKLSLENKILAYHLTQAAIAGAHVATMPWNILQAMVKHPLTDIGIERFLADSRKYSSV